MKNHGVQCHGIDATIQGIDAKAPGTKIVTKGRNISVFMVS